MLIFALILDRTNLCATKVTVSSNPEHVKLADHPPRFTDQDPEHSPTSDDSRFSWGEQACCSAVSRLLRYPFWFVFLFKRVVRRVKARHTSSEVSPYPTPALVDDQSEPTKEQIEDTIELLRTGRRNPEDHQKLAATLFRALQAFHSTNGSLSESFNISESQSLIDAIQTVRTSKNPLHGRHSYPPSSK